MISKIKKFPLSTPDEEINKFIASSAVVDNGMFIKEDQIIFIYNERVVGVTTQEKIDRLENDLFGHEKSIFDWQEELKYWYAIKAIDREKQQNPSPSEINTNITRLENRIADATFRADIIRKSLEEIKNG